MNPLKIVAIILIVGGILGLAYGSFTYISDSHSLDIGITELHWNEKETVYIPVWVGIAGIVGGGLMLYSRKGRTA